RGSVRRAHCARRGGGSPTPRAASARTAPLPAPLPNWGAGPGTLPERAGRVLSYRVVDQRAHGLAPSADTNVARVAGTFAEQWVADLALELSGAEGFEAGAFADAQFRMAMTAGGAVGATEVQLNLIAGRFLGLPRE